MAKQIARAMFEDSYFGRVPVKLVPVGRNGRCVWQGCIQGCVTTGYRPLPQARALAAADRDFRFSEIEILP